MRKRLSENHALLLADINLLSQLESSDLEQLAKICTWRHFSANEQIIDRQSDTGDIYFVVEGKVRIANYSLSGREITLDNLDKGAHFGELAAIDGQPRSASVLAITDCYLALLSPRHFETLCISHPDIAFQVMRSLATIVRSATERIMDLSTLAANNRVQAELLREARQNLTGENRAEISPIPVHGDVASRVSTTRETVARVMGDLTKQGIVERAKDSLIILDVETLEEMVIEVKGD
jgi:CRP-like cAMP-binding protein